MDAIVKVLIFVAGVIVSVVLVPVIERRKIAIQRAQNAAEIYLELEDLKEELASHVKAYFNLLLRIKAGGVELETGRIFVPITHSVDLSILMELYKKSLFDLTGDQRRAIKSLPRTVGQIVDQAKNFESDFLDRKTYSIAFVKNTIKLSCAGIYEINQLIQHRERFRFGASLNSNEATPIVLRSLGYGMDDISKSRIEESDFVGANCPS